MAEPEFTWWTLSQLDTDLGDMYPPTGRVIVYSEPQCEGKQAYANVNFVASSIGCCMRGLRYAHRRLGYMHGGPRSPGGHRAVVGQMRC